MIGRKLGNYEIVDKLGEGGMGEVWRARDARLNRTVAVKVLSAEFAGDPARRQRFEQEARALGAVNHPNIVAIYDIGQSDGRAYLVSELVEGESLRKIIDRGPLGFRKLIEIAVQTAEAIAAAHALGIVHRDLKPENIMVTGSVSGSPGRVKVLDFGLAKQSALPTTTETETIALSQPGMVLGTVGYMAPEQVRGEPVDGRSDIFSLGCVLYELATGRRAFEGKSAADVMSAILREEPPEMVSGDTPVPAPLERIVRRCLEKDPRERFQSAADLAFALRAAGGASTSQTVAMKAAPAPRHKWLIPAVAVVAAIALFAAGYFLRGRLVSTAAPQFRRITFRDGRVTAARFAPDGQQVIYAASLDGGPSHIYLATPGNPEARDLELPESHLLSVSSKGDLAFLVGPFTPDGFGTLARSSIAGGQTRELLERVLLADWSPDGSELAIVRKTGGRTAVEYPVGKVLFQTDWSPFSLRVSPDGQRLAFTHYTHGSGIGLFIAERGGAARAIGNISGQTAGVDASSLYWTRDGREIWYRSLDTNDANTIYAINLQGKIRVVARFPSQVKLFDVAVDGRVLMSTESGRLGIRGLAPGDTVERDLSCLESSVLSGISDDGGLIVADVLGEGGGITGSIYLRRTDGTPPVRLGDGAATILSPDGKWVSGYASRETARRKFILTPTGPGEIQPQTDHGIVVGWLSGEGNYLLAVRATGTYQFVAWNAETDKLRPASPNGMPQQVPFISPDRRFFVADSPDHQMSVYSIETGEGRPIQGMTHHDQVINWRSDGRALYISTHHDMNQMLPVSVLDLETGKRTPWKIIQPSIPVDEVSNIHITPDGRAYAYNYSYVRSELYVAEGIR
jgi:eukaryotic-like serine/threonine-protein kinase